MEHVIDIDRVAEIDYLIGDDLYKRDWVSCRRERRGLIAFNPAFPLGWLGAIRHFAGKDARLCGVTLARRNRYFAMLIF